jgi:hypothetical protein
MAWGIFMTFITLFAMMVLAIHEAMTTDTASRSSTDFNVVDGGGVETHDVRKAA